ncbi:MAG TPA: hypothetical protein VGF25_13070 [Thermoleophilaceae bacterium]|jgi:hypothetical protein
MRARNGLALIAVVLVNLTACDSGADDEQGELTVPKLTDAQVIRGWLAELGVGDYHSAGTFFARDALIFQTHRIRLHTLAQAIDFNSSLPCRADLAETERQGPRTLATFKLKAGPGGPCSGSVQVRVLIREGRFREWIQLPNEPEPPEPKPQPDDRPQRSPEPA